MYRTAEVRWFSIGPPPESLLDWFENLREGTRERRTDIYLGPCDTDAVGVKLRDTADSLEVKVREYGLGRTEFPGGIAGHVERWAKWSFPIAPRSVSELDLTPAFWIEVAKTRCLATFELTSGGMVSLADHAVDDGCSVELTGLGVDGQEWWTVGFEAFGAEDSLVRGLTATVAAFFVRPSTGYELNALDSYGYPAWLQSLTRSVDSSRKGEVRS